MRGVNIIRIRVARETLTAQTRHGRNLWESSFRERRVSDIKLMRTVNPPADIHPRLCRLASSSRSESESEICLMSKLPLFTP